jgi:anti-sigma B factor antagonist
MLIENRGDENILVLEVQERRFTASNVPDFKQFMRQTIKEHHEGVVLDLSSVEFMDSSGLGSLVSVARMMGGKNNLRVVCPHGAVRDLFRLTRMDQAFAIFDSVEAARAGQNQVLSG